MGRKLSTKEFIERAKAAYQIKSQTLPFERRREEPQLHWELLSVDQVRFALKPGATSIGRKSENDVWLKDNQVSRFHAEIREFAGRFAIIDLDSSNGTTLNRIRIESNKPYPLSEGDQLSIGSSLLTLKRTD